MSYASLPLEIKSLAEERMTEKQLKAWTLELAGLSPRRIADHLELRRSTVIDRLEGAHHVLRKAGVVQDEFGRWTIRQEAA